MSSQNLGADIEKSVLTEINLFEENANILPKIENIEILKKVRAVWVLSGSGSCLKPLIDTASDQVNLRNTWYHGTDKARLDYAARWLHAYKNILPEQDSPFLIYNGVLEQNNDLLQAIEGEKYPIPTSQVYIAPGKNVRTLDQVRNFSFPTNLDLQDGYLAIVSHASHLVRTLKFMNKYPEIFHGITVIALPLIDRDQRIQAKMDAPEIKGILDYIAKNEATEESYPYIILK